MQVLYEFRARHPAFRSNPFAQQDSHEFLRCFLDTLNAELREPVLPEFADAPDSEASSDTGEARRGAGSHEEDVDGDGEEAASTTTANPNRNLLMNGAFGAVDSATSSHAASSSSKSPQAAAAYEKHCRRVLEEYRVEKEAADSSADASLLAHADDADSAVPPSDMTSSGAPTPDTTSLNSHSPTASTSASIGEQQETSSLKSAASSVVVSLSSTPSSTAVDMHSACPRPGLPVPIHTSSNGKQCTPLSVATASDVASRSSSNTSTSSSSFESAVSHVANSQAVSGSGAPRGPLSSETSHNPTPSPKPTRKKRPPRRYRSIISDVFEGKLISTVQCLHCKKVNAQPTSRFYQNRLSIAK